MNVVLRIMLLLLSLVAFAFCIKNISKSKLKASNSVIWMVGSILLIIISLFPEMVVFLSKVFGFMAASNFVFFVMIIFLLIELFSADKRISELSEKVKELDHYIALKEYDERKNDK